MLPISSTQRVSDVEGVLVVEENNSPTIISGTILCTYVVHSFTLVLLLTLGAHAQGLRFVCLFLSACVRVCLQPTIAFSQAFIDSWILYANEV